MSAVTDDFCKLLDQAEELARKVGEISEELAVLLEQSEPVLLEEPEL